MPTGNNIATPLIGTAVAPTTGPVQQALVSFGGSNVLQACTSMYLEVVLNDPTNTGDPATFSIQPMVGFSDAANPIGEPITTTGLMTVTSFSPFTHWTMELLSLSGGTAPTITVRGVAGE